MAELDGFRERLWLGDKTPPPQPSDTQWNPGADPTSPGELTVLQQGRAGVSNKPRSDPRKTTVETNEGLNPFFLVVSLTCLLGRAPLLARNGKTRFTFRANDNLLGSCGRTSGFIGVAFAKNVTIKEKEKETEGRRT